MKNPATTINWHSALNEFSQHLLDNPGVIVKLRNGTMVAPVVFLGEEPWEDDFKKPRGFQDGSWNYCWKLSGVSVTRSDYDMVELV